jgi:hypothetical protein
MSFISITIHNLNVTAEAAIAVTIFLIIGFAAIKYIM